MEHYICVVIGNVHLLCKELLKKGSLLSIELLGKERKEEGQKQIGKMQWRIYGLL